MSQNPIRILPFGDNSSFSTSNNGEKEIKRRDTTELAPLKMVIKKAWLPVTMAPWKMVLWDGSEVQMIGRTSNWPCNRQRPPSTWGGVGNGVGNVAFWSRMGGDKNRHDMTGWWFGTWILLFHRLGISSSQLTNSYFSEGWNHQTDGITKDWACCML